MTESNIDSVASGTDQPQPQAQAQAQQPVTEAQYKQALKRLNKLEKQNAFLIDELVKSRQCLMQMKLEREVIIDRVADSLVNEFEDEEEEEEDISDISDEEGSRAGLKTTNSSAFLKRKRELIDELVDEAEGDETFSKVLSELSGYQPVGESSKKKSISLTLSVPNSSNNHPSSSAAAAASSINAKKRKSPPTSGSRFNRLSALTQAMRTGIISDDEGSGSGINENNLNIDVIGQGNQDPSSIPGNEDYFDIDEPELAQLKKVRRASLTGGNNLNPSHPETPSKEESTVYKVIPVQFDSEGNPQLPLSLNMITVHRLGEIVHDRPAYHSKRYILPVGFTTSRSYFSVLSPDSLMNYYSTILDNGPTPLYQVTPEGHPEMTFQSTSTTGAWAAVSKAAAAIRGKDSAPSVSGPDFFGLANPTVSMLIERLPNSDKCESYVPKKYEVSNLVGGKSAKRIESTGPAVAATSLTQTDGSNPNNNNNNNTFDIINSSYM